jgi:hypothetical protein
MIKQLRNYSLGNSLISTEAFEVLGNYTKTDMKIIQYFEQSLDYLEKLIESIRKTRFLVRHTDLLRKVLAMYLHKLTANPFFLQLEIS